MEDRRTEQTEQPVGKKAVNDQPLSLEQVQEMLGADKVEVVGLPQKAGLPDEVINLAAAQKQKQNQQRIARMNDLLGGKVPPPNDFVAYLVKQVHDARAEMSALGESIRQAEMQLQKMRERVLILHGEHNKSLQDIQHWDRPVNHEGDKEKKG